MVASGSLMVASGEHPRVVESLNNSDEFLNDTNDPDKIAAAFIQKICESIVDPTDALEAEAHKADFLHYPFKPGIEALLDHAIGGWLSMPGNNEISFMEIVQDILDDLPQTSRRYTSRGVWKKVMSVVIDHLMYDQGWSQEECVRWISIQTIVGRKLYSEIRKSEELIESERESEKETEGEENRRGESEEE